MQRRATSSATKPAKLMLLAGLLSASAAANAMDVEPGVGLGLRFTDNSRLANVDEQDDLVVAGYVGATVDESSGGFRMTAQAGLTYLSYVNDTFDDQYFPALRLTGGYEQIRDRLDWKLNNYYTQVFLNPLVGPTPDNIQDFNAFTFGPTISVPVSRRHTITVGPTYRNFYFELLTNDSEQFELSANWAYRMYPTLEVNLDIRTAETMFENVESLSDFTRSAALVGLAGKTARSEYSLDVGAARISRDTTDNTTEPVGNFTWTRNLTPYSTASVRLSSDLTDTGNLLLDEISDPDGGGSNIQVSNNALRANRARLAYRHGGATLTTRVWAQYLEQDFLGVRDGDNDDLLQRDRRVSEIGASMNYRVTDVFSTGLSALYTHTRETDGDRTNTRYLAAATVGYQLTRKLQANWQLRYETQDNELNQIADYGELSTFVWLVYGAAGSTPFGQGGSSGAGRR